MSERPPIGAGGPAQTRLGQLFDAHSDRLYRLARRLAPSADDALDLVQETFLRATRTARSIPSEANEAEAWLVRVLVNLRRDQWRREAVQKRHQHTVQETAPRRNPEDVLVDRAMVWQALDSLPPRRRAIVVMHEIDGMPIASIATLLTITAITVRWHLSRGRRALAHTLRLNQGDAHADADRTVEGRRPDPSRTAAS